MPKATLFLPLLKIFLFDKYFIIRQQLSKKSMILFNVSPNLDTTKLYAFLLSSYSETEYRHTQLKLEALSKDFPN